MLFRTHIAFGFLIGLYLIDLFNVDRQILFMIVLLFFSIFPDIDGSSSKVFKKLRPFSYIAALLGHRKVFHTIYFPIALFLVLFVFDLKLVSMGVLVGYLLHLFLDLITKKGLALFYPLSRKRVRGFVKVGSLIENIVFFIVLVLIVYQLIL